MKIVAGNFKSHLTRSESIDFFLRLDSLLNQISNDKDVYIFPSISSISSNIYKNLTIGAQNCHDSISGPFTGEISLLHLNEFNITSILIGHSERRNIFNEDDLVCARKFAFFKENNFKIFYCIGESLDIRNSGEYLDFLKNQLLCIDINYDNLVVAYEPLWAIGTGLNADIVHIRECVNYLREITVAPIIYGGSVNSNNAKSILEVSDGVLVGSASLDIDSFYSIINC